MPKHLQGVWGEKKARHFLRIIKPRASVERLQHPTPPTRAGSTALRLGGVTGTGSGGCWALRSAQQRPHEPPRAAPLAAVRRSPRRSSLRVSPWGCGAAPRGSRDPALDDITAWARPFVCAPRGREGKKGKKKENFWKSLRFLRSSLLLADGPPLSPPPSPARNASL